MIKKNILTLGMLFFVFGLFYDFILVNSVIAFGKKQIFLIGIGLLLLTFSLLIKKEIFSPQWKNSKNWLVLQLKRINLQLSRHLDLLVILFFVFIGICFFFGRWQGNLPVVHIGTDAANVATYSAVTYHPQNFTADFIYGDKQNFSYYVSIYIPLLQILSSIMGGYGIAYLSLLIPIIVLHGTGFYYLGKALYQKRFWAFLLAISSLIIIYTESSDYWGIYQDPQPRMLFGAVFPWSLLLAYQSLSNPKLRFLTILLLGAMLYINPVSIPGVAFSIWLGFLVFKPREKKTLRHLTEVLGFGLLFASMAIPFAMIYLQSRTIIPTSVDYSEAISYFAASNMGMFSLKETLLGFLKTMTNTFLLPLGVISGVLAYVFTIKKREVLLISIWIFGLVLIGGGLTWLGNTIAKATQTMPILLQMNRDLRYVVPLLEIILFLPLAYASKQIKGSRSIDTSKMISLKILGIVILFILTSSFYTVTKEKLDVKMYTQKTITCLTTKKLFCSPMQNKHLVELLEYVRNETQENENFITYPSIDIRRQIRYQGLRSIAFDINDINALRIVDPGKALAFRDLIDSWETIENVQDKKQQETLFIQFARELKADYAIMLTPVNAEFVNEVVYSNETYSIIRLSTP